MESGLDPLYCLYVILERRGANFLAFSFLIPGLHRQILALFWLPKVPGLKGK